MSVRGLQRAYCLLLPANVPFGASRRARMRINQGFARAYDVLVPDGAVQAPAPPAAGRGRQAPFPPPAAGALVAAQVYLPIHHEFHQQLNRQVCSPPCTSFLLAQLLPLTTIASLSPLPFFCLPPSPHVEGAGNRKRQHKGNTGAVCVYVGLNTSECVGLNPPHSPPHAESQGEAEGGNAAA